MTRLELSEFRHLRWLYIKTGRGRIMRDARYKELYLRFWESASELDGVQRVIYTTYYHDARTITYIAMMLNYSERSVKRIKRTAVMRIVG